MNDDKKSKRELPPTGFSLATSREIERRRYELGVSKTTFAKRVGLSANYMAERLRFEKNFTVADIEKIAGYFNMTAADFMCSVPNVGADGDTLGIDSLGVLTSDERARVDYARAAKVSGAEAPDPDQGTQEEHDDDDARPGA